MTGGGQIQNTKIQKYKIQNMEIQNLFYGENIFSPDVIIQKRFCSVVNILSERCRLVNMEETPEIKNIGKLADQTF